MVSDRTENTDIMYYVILGIGHLLATNSQNTQDAENNHIHPHFVKKTVVELIKRKL